MDGLSQKQIDLLRYLYSNSERIFTFEELKSAVPYTEHQILRELYSEKLIWYDSVGLQKINISSKGEARIEEIDARIKWEKEQEEYHRKAFIQTQESIKVSKRTFWITLIAAMLTGFGALWAVFEWLLPAFL